MKYADKIKQMTLKEKCAILTGADVWHTHAVERLGIPAMMLSDGPSGLRKQAAGGDHLGLNASVPATCMPSSSAVANSWNPAVAEAAGRVIGSEAAAENVRVLLGPGLNTKRSPLCGRDFEYYSEDPYLSGKMAAAYIRGVQQNGVSACAKHFAVNSQETLRMSSDSVLDERTLRELYLTNFEIAVKEGKPQAVMTSYNRVNGVYTNESSHLQEEILRGEWGFEGMVVTDWGGSNDFVEGVRAGCNLEMPAAGEESAVQLFDAVKAGKISEKLVDERVDQLLQLVMTCIEEGKAPKKDLEAGHRIAAESADECMVLLKNEQSALPLTGKEKIAVIGDFVQRPRYQGAGSSMVNSAKEDKAQDLLKDYFPAMTGYAAGFRRLDEPDEALTAEAVALAKDAENVLLYIGLTEGYETEGLDRTHMRIPQNQIDLIDKLYAQNKHIIAVIFAGSAIEMPWIDKCEAVLWAGLAGQASANSVLKILSGRVNPSGKLSESFPITLSQAPVTQYYPGSQATSEYREGIYVGYRAYETANIPVRFPFGFGLSYTTFGYSNLSVSEKEVSFDLTNTGSMDGAEVSQVYVSLPGAKIFRAKKELKGFSKTFLKAGETKHVSIPLDDKAFRYFNVKTNRWEIEGGEYVIAVSVNCQKDVLTGKVTVKGTGAPDPYAGKQLSCYQQCKLDDIPDAQFSALLGRTIPKHNWDTKALLQMNDTVSQMYYAKNPIARFACKVLKNKMEQSVKNGKPDLNMLFIYNIPFRGMGKMMNGAVTMKMAQAILFMVNGHGFRGFGRLIKALICKDKLSSRQE